MPSRHRTGPGPTITSRGSLTVSAGQSFWSIAVAVVTARVGPAAPYGRTAGYWAELVAVNSRHLHRPGDPSIIYPGDVIVLPPLG